MEEYKPNGIKEHIAFYVAKLLVCASEKWPESFLPPDGKETDLYASSMTPDFNWLHKKIFPRFFGKISVENLELARDLPKDSVIVYATRDIGQLEYNFFNYLFLSERLPLARFVNELSLWQWLPFRQIKYILTLRAKKFLKNGPLPHPVSSGYLRSLTEKGDAVFIRLKSTAIFDDLYWYTSEKDPLTDVVETCQKGIRPVYIVPLHFIWDKRPEGSSNPLVELLPARIKKLISFWRNYKNRAVVKIGGPMPIADCIDVKKLRGDLLKILQQEKKAITGPALKPRSWIIDRMIEDSEVQKAAYDISLEKKTSIDDVKTLVLRYADEIAADINYSYIENGCRIIKWVIRNIYDGIVLDIDGLNRLKKAASRAPIVLVPNHRSHMDYLLLSTMLYEHNVAIPHIAAGLNLAFWPMGHIFRRCGAFFLRRSFGSNKLYRAVFKTYLKILMQEGYCQEFFIEGTRSRTGKLLRPRTGILSMISDIVKNGSVNEVLFVPVAITYDQILEEYKNEIDGGAKRPERTRDLMKLGKFFRRNYGRIYLRFGEPISCTKNEADVSRLANSIMVSINKEVVVTPSAVAAASILLSQKPGITRESLMWGAGEIIKYLKWKGARFSESLSDTGAVMEAVQKFIASKYIIPHDDFEPVCYEINHEKRIEMDYYKNTIIHFFVSASCIASILLSLQRKGSPKSSLEEIKGAYLFCKKLFAYEFAFSTRMNVEEHISKILSWFEEEGVANAIGRLEVYKGWLTNFFEANLVMLMAARKMASTDEKAAMKIATKFGRHLILLGRITRPEAISAPMFKNAIGSLVDIGILGCEICPNGRKLYSWKGQDEIASKLQQQLEELC